MPKLSPSPALAPAPGMLSAALQGQLPSHAHQPGPPTPPRTPQVSQPLPTTSYMSAFTLLQIQGNKFEESRGGGAGGAVPKMPSLLHAMGLQQQLQQLPKPPPLAAVGAQLQHGKQGLQGTVQYSTVQYSTVQYSTGTARSAHARIPVQLSTARQL